LEKDQHSHGVALHFNEELEKEIFKIWQEMSKRGVAEFPLASGMTPHMTLGLYNNIDVNKFTADVEKFAKETEPFSTDFYSAGIFPTEIISLFIYPVPTKDLIKIHNDFHKFVQIDDDHSHQYYLPGRWIPHTTLAYNADESRIDSALFHEINAFFPLSGSITAVSIAHLWPFKEICRFQFDD